MEDFIFCALIANSMATKKSKKIKKRHLDACFIPLLKLAILVLPPDSKAINIKYIKLLGDQEWLVNM